MKSLYQYIFHKSIVFYQFMDKQPVAQIIHDYVVVQPLIQTCQMYNLWFHIGYILYHWFL